MSQRHNPALSGLLCSVGLIAIAVVVLFANWSARPEQSRLDSFKGSLVEWSTSQGTRATFLRFSLEGRGADFRLDPKHFQNVLDRSIPAEFRKGAAVEVFADHAALAAGGEPALLSSTRIIWVRGLVVDGRAVVGLEDLKRSESIDNFWGYIFLTCSLAAFVYYLMKWRNVGDKVPSPSRHRRGVRMAGIAVGLLTVILGVVFVYYDFVVPARDINRFGVDEVRPWTERDVFRNSWPGGSATQYVFPVSLETENRLREKCAAHSDSVESPGSGMCTFAIELPPESRVMVVARVGRGAAFLEYNSGVVPPPSITSVE